MPRKGSRKTTARSKRSRRSKRKSAAKTSPKRSRTRFRNAPGEIDNVYTPGVDTKPPLSFPVLQVAQEYVNSQALYLRQLLDVLDELEKNNDNDAIKIVDRNFYTEQRFEKKMRDMYGGVVDPNTLFDILKEIHKHAAISFNYILDWILYSPAHNIKPTETNSILTERFSRVQDLVKEIIGKMTLDEENEDREARGWTKEHTELIIELRKLYHLMEIKAKLVDRKAFLYPVAQVAQEYVKSQALYMRQLFDVLTELGKNNENPNDESIFNVEAMKTSVKKMILIEQKFEKIFRDMTSERGGVMGVYDLEKETTFLDLLIEIHNHASQGFDSMPHEYWIYTVGNKRLKVTAINTVPSQRFIRVKELIESIIKKMTLDQEYEDREDRGWAKEHTEIIVALQKLKERLESKATLINQMMTMAELCACEGDKYSSEDSLCHLVTRLLDKKGVKEDIRTKKINIRDYFK